MKMTILRFATAGSFCALARFGADSIATRSDNGGNLAFFACCDELAPSAARFSAEAWFTRGVGILKGMAEVLF